ncbi:MAG: UDP-2,3-diacylglucosamine diphosphatase [Paracoccaceae bacterium]
MLDFAPHDPATQRRIPDQNPPNQNPAARHFPVLFLSDLHLGSRACRDEALLGFLQAHTADVIYLVGDIIDTWTAASNQWTANHHAILQLLFDRAKNGTRLIYTPGNHDAFFRQYCGQRVANIDIVPHAIHRAADGRRYLVTHGDTCDVFGQRFPMLERLGAFSESVLRAMGDRFNAVMQRFGRRGWPIVDHVVNFANDVVRGLDAFDKRLVELARSHGADGIICGHFHKPALHSDHGIPYANCGDWVENSTALAETTSGRLLLLDWGGQAQDNRRAAPRLSIGATA